MTPLPDVVVVGAGAVGASCARALAQSGANVLLLDRAEPAGAAWVASAGMLAAQVEAGPDDPLLPLALAGRAWFAALPTSLREQLGTQTCGIVDVASSPIEAASLKDRVAWQQRRGLRAEWLDSSALASRIPWLAPAGGAFLSPDDGALDPQRLVSMLRSDAIAHGAQLINDAAIRIDHDGSVVRGVIGKHGRYAAATVVLAAGAWTATLGNMPRSIPVEPMRGQMISFPWPVGAASAIVYGEGCYLLRRSEEMLVGATMERVGFDAGVTAAGAAELHARAVKVYPGLAALIPSRHWAGLRPATPDGLPIIGAEPRLRGLWYATGHGRNGVLLAGVTGDLIARSIARGEIDEELAPFSAARF